MNTGPFHSLASRAFHLTYTLGCVSFTAKCFWAAEEILPFKVEQFQVSRATCSALCGDLGECLYPLFTFKICHLSTGGVVPQQLDPVDYKGF